MKLDQQTIWNSRVTDLGHNFSVTCRELCDENPVKLENPLEDVMVTTMTELWDRGFSQTEVRNAFESAIGDLPRYAAGEECRE